MEEDETLATMISEELKNGANQSDNFDTNTLNKEQQYAYNTILHRILNDDSGMFFVDRPGGTSKIYLYKALLAAVRSRNLIALATSSFGVVASLLLGGRIAHSRFKIPLEITDDVGCLISK
ncbi:ATP-dependent DNA helicase PIF4-like [Olea europaea subsp. europaea]|uniref:ATP-dependent DNA helicase n=2 Tax=Olea europaea subsp. europaea TaxID=158383 RepID=A0A8S0SJT6_OLEEU|nr:ATP-dependent DNA helicase PIF4-like [Olea europaea subsp. europaea]